MVEFQTLSVLDDLLLDRLMSLKSHYISSHQFLLLEGRPYPCLTLL